MSATVTSSRQYITLLKSPWVNSFNDLVLVVEHELLVVSPFIKAQAVNQMLENLHKRGMESQVQVMVLTNLRPESLLSGSTDVEAISAMSRSLQSLRLVHLPSLHAKVYVADDKVAVVTSANLTQPGISGNLEYGVRFTEQRFVREIRRDFEGYSSLGAVITAQDVDIIFRETRELKEAFTQAEKSIREEAKRAFHEKLDAARVRLLRQRATGKSTHKILADTILFLLAKGPLRTTELHPLIQQIHSDICDDSVDRVIDGVHFGKRWKHHVRTAQAYLKRTGKIFNDNGRWYLAEADR